jgi:hypothetical protein
MKNPEITKLYKYRGYSARILTMLSSNELYFAASDSFNDPFDCRARKDFEFIDDDDFIEKWSVLERNRKGITIEDAKSNLKVIASDPVKKGQYIKEQSNEFQKIVLQSFGICSFSEVNNDILMWSHYSDSHYGLCLEFKRSPTNTLENAQPITYPNDDDFPYIDYWPDNEEELLSEVEKIILTKSRHWGYEKEWRIIQRPITKNNDYKGHLVKYEKELLTGVIFGYRMSNKERNTIKGILSGHSVQYYEAKPVKNKFLIEVTKV